MVANFGGDAPLDPPRHAKAKPEQHKITMGPSKDPAHICFLPAAASYINLAYSAIHNCVPSSTWATQHNSLPQSPVSRYLLRLSPYFFKILHAIIFPLLIRGAPTFRLPYGTHLRDYFVIILFFHSRYPSYPVFSRFFSFFILSIHDCEIIESSMQRGEPCCFQLIFVQSCKCWHVLFQAGYSCPYQPCDLS